MEAMREKIRNQVLEGFLRRSVQFVQATFDAHKDKTKQVIFASSLGRALSDMGVHSEPTEIEELLKSWDLNDDGGLDFQEFASLVSMPSPTEEWVAALPLTKLVSDALPRASCSAKDQLRHLSKTTPEELKVSCEIITEKLLEVLQEKLDDLKKSFEKLDSEHAAESNPKFQIFKMGVGNIADFHEGLSSRIGNGFLHLHFDVFRQCKLFIRVAVLT
jgi:Ca2+-binding EF-hand superfamily protein